MASFHPSSYSVQAIKKKIANNGIEESYLSDTVSFPVLRTNAEAVSPIFEGIQKDTKSFVPRKQKIPIQTSIARDSLPPSLASSDVRVTEPAGTVAVGTGFIGAVLILTGLSTPFGWTLTIILGILTLILGVSSLIRIGKNPKKFKGRGWAWLGLILNLPALYILVFIIAYSCSV